LEEVIRLNISENTEGDVELNHMAPYASIRKGVSGLSQERPTVLS